MVGFVFWIGMSIALLLLAFVSARFVFKAMKSKDYYTMSYWLLMTVLAVICGISSPVIAMTEIPVSSASETVSDIKVFSKKEATCIIVYDGDIIENFVPPHNMPNWKIQLIKDPALLDKNTSHYIAIPEDNSYCYLLKSKRPRDIDGSIKIK